MILRLCGLSLNLECPAYIDLLRTPHSLISKNSWADELSPVMLQVAHCKSHIIVGINSLLLFITKTSNLKLVTRISGFDIMALFGSVLVF